MRGIAQVQIPMAVIAAGLEGKGMGQCVNLGRCYGVAHSGAKADGNLQAVVRLEQRIGRRINGEIAQSGERDPCCLRNAAEDSSELARCNTNHGEFVAIEGNCFAQNRGVSVKAIAPQRIRENDLVILAISAVVAVAERICRLAA